MHIGLKDAAFIDVWLFFLPVKAPLLAYMSTQTSVFKCVLEEEHLQAKKKTSAAQFRRGAFEQKKNVKKRIYARCV